MNLATLIVCMEEKRRGLYDAELENRIKISQELDVLINEYYRLQQHCNVA
jgi:hypothetical protein